MITHIGDRTIEEVIESGELIIPSTFMVFPVDGIIYRCRYHDSDRVPQTKNDVYYPPEQRISLGRANHFEEQVFYGMLTSGNPHARLACYHEVTDRIEDVQTFTLSRWRIKKDLDKVLSLVMHESQAEGNEFALNCYRHTMDFLDDLPEHVRPKVRETLRQIGTRFSRKIPDCDYWWTANLASHMFYREQFKAIIYPSIPYEHRAVCIAMPGLIADEYLELLSGSLMQLHRSRGIVREFSYRHFRVKGDCLIWSDDDTSQPGRPSYARSTIPRDCSPCERQRDLFFLHMARETNRA